MESEMAPCEKRSRAVVAEVTNLSSWETSLSSCGGSIVDQALLIAHTETRTGGQKLERGTTIFCSCV